jgi:hypothetical protein
VCAFAPGISTQGRYGSGKRLCGSTTRSMPASIQADLSGVVQLGVAMAWAAQRDAQGQQRSTTKACKAAPWRACSAELVPSSRNSASESVASASAHPTRCGAPGSKSRAGMHAQWQWAKKRTRRTQIRRRARHDRRRPNPRVEDGTAASLSGWLWSRSHVASESESGTQILTYQALKLDSESAGYQLRSLSALRLPQCPLQARQPKLDSSLG